jgi:hypothetical protein
MYGENDENEDCFDIPNNDCDHCVDRYGLIFASVYNETHRDRETENWEWLPLFNYSNCWFDNNEKVGEVIYKDNRWFNYYDEDGETTCGSK